MSTTITVDMDYTFDDKINQTGSNVTDVSDIIYSPEYLAFSIAVIFLSLVGTAGNIPVLIVYYRKNDKKVSNTFIKILAAIDLLMCVFVMPYTLVYELHLVRSDFSCRLFEFLRHFTVLASSTTLVAIAAERYFAVCHFAKKFTVKNVNCGMFVVMMISIVLAVPAVLIFALVTPNDVKDVVCRFPHSGNNTHFCHFTTSIIGPLLAHLYQSLLMLTNVLSFFFIVVFYCIVYARLWGRTKLKTLQIRPHRKHIYDNKSETSAVSCEKRADCGQCVCDNQISNNNIVEDTNEECSEISCYTEGYFSQGSLPKSDSQRGPVKPKRLTLHYRTAKMLFVCSVIFLVTWLPFWFDIFGITHSLLLRYMFFIGNATNPIVYGIYNVHVRQSFIKLFYDCKSSISLVLRGHIKKGTTSSRL